MVGNLNISIFPGAEVNSSIDRYCRELRRNLPPELVVRVVSGNPASRWRKTMYKYTGYPWLARRQQGDYNIILSESSAFLLPFLNRHRTVIICHDVHPLYFRLNSVAYRIRFRVNLWLMKLAKKIVAVSLQTKEDLAHFCPYIPPDKITVVHNGLSSHWRQISDPVDLESFRSKWNLSCGKVVLHVGNDMKHKNVATVLRAVALLADPEIVFFKVGPLGPENRRLIEHLGIRNRVSGTEHATDEDLLRFYNIASVLVFPSLREGFGWPPLEAMACGCPVITCQTGSLPEVCGQACLYVDPFDARSMADAISRVISDSSLRKNLIELGKARANTYGWNSTVEGILAALRN
jgi:glycosyltransferase involved in cell wall biosynthesis